MRCFLGFEPSPQTKLAMQSWREKALGYFEKSVPAANFHVTAVFLGQCSDSQLDTLCNEIESYQYPSFSLNFDQLGYWAKPKILYLGCQQVPTSVIKSVNQLTTIAKRSQLNIVHRDYTPHVTIVRNNKSNPPAPLFEPDISCSFTHLHLYESVSANSGVQYLIRKSWPLSPIFKR